jgi:hypothetical protein
MTGNAASPAHLRSPGAYRHFRDLVEQYNRSPIVVKTDFRLTEAEMTWDALTAFEAEAFGIDPRLLNALVVAAMRYSDLSGVTDFEFHRFREEERQAYPEFFLGECASSMDAAVGFMVVACELPFTQALLWVCRAQVQMVRSNLFTQSNTAPAWAFGTVEG